KNGTNIPGQTNAVLDLGSVRLSDSGTYTLMAKNSFGTAVSSAMALIVNDVVFNFLAIMPGANENIYLTINLPLGRRYRLQKSLDLKTWRDVMDITPTQVPHEAVIY